MRNFVNPRWLWNNPRAARGGMTSKPMRPKHVGIEMLEDRVLFNTYNVNSTLDSLNPPAGVVTLRQAIALSNDNPAADTINLTVPGTYKITIPGANEPFDSTGDFNISASGGNLIITNTSKGAVVVNANHLDRAFNINATGVSGNAKYTVTMNGFTITNGYVTGSGFAADGGGILVQGNANLTLTNMIVTRNTSFARGRDRLPKHG